MLYDVNSLYPTIMSSFLPVGDFYELTPEEIQNFNPETVRIDGEHC